MSTRRILMTAVAFVASFSAVSSAQQNPSPAPSPTEVASSRVVTGDQTHREIGVDDDLATLTLVRSSVDRAVVRFGTKPLEVVAVGDRLGRTRAEVKDIDAERLVLEEAFREADGQANRAVIILKKGERGGKRYVSRPDTQPPPAVRPVVVDPSAEQKR
jgi:hypothetical protein